MVRSEKRGVRIMPLRVMDLDKEEYVLPGNPSCLGCPASLGLRMLGKVLGPKTVLVIPASCSSIIQGVYPKSSIKLPLLNIATFGIGVFVFLHISLTFFSSF